MSFAPVIRRSPHEHLAVIRRHPCIVLILVDGFPTAVEMQGQAEEPEVPSHPCGARTVLRPVLFTFFVLGDQVFQGEPGSALGLRKPDVHPAHVTSELPGHFNGFRTVAPED